MTVNRVIRWPRRRAPGTRAGRRARSRTDSPVIIVSAPGGYRSDTPPGQPISKRDIARSSQLGLIPRSLLGFSRPLWYRPRQWLWPGL